MRLEGSILVGPQQASLLREDFVILGVPLKDLLGFVASTDDMQGAFRQIPVAPSVDVGWRCRLWPSTTTSELLNLSDHARAGQTA